VRLKLEQGRARYYAGRYAVIVDLEKPVPLEAVEEILQRLEDLFEEEGVARALAVLAASDLSRLAGFVRVTVASRLPPTEPAARAYGVNGLSLPDPPCLN